MQVFYDTEETVSKNVDKNLEKLKNDWQWNILLLAYFFRVCVVVFQQAFRTTCHQFVLIDLIDNELG